MERPGLNPCGRTAGAVQQHGIMPARAALFILDTGIRNSAPPHHRRRSRTLRDGSPDRRRAGCGALAAARGDGLAGIARLSINRSHSTGGLPAFISHHLLSRLDSVKRPLEIFA
jgi:hypothetical protein